MSSSHQEIYQRLLPQQKVNLTRLVKIHVDELYENRDEWKGVCPFCNGGNKKEAVFHINVDTGLSICHRAVKCGWKGNAVTFISELLDLSYEDAKDYLNEGASSSPAEIIAILKDRKDNSYEPIPDTVSIEGSMPATELQGTPQWNYLNGWLTRRGYDPEAFLEAHSVSLPPSGLYTGRAIFNISSNRVKGYQLYDMTGKMERKTINPSNEFLSRMLYGYDNWKNDSSPILIHEGIFDAARSMSRGYNATCIFGTNLSETQKYLLTESKAEKFIVCLDGDTATSDITKDKAWKIAKELSETGRLTLIARLPKTEDPDSCDEATFDACVDKAYEVISLENWLYAKL